ncbi:NACHT domain-containing protein [Streptomyces sp. NPDC059991]|uniref:NACHT domain-containing protein n=1 Tax=Streptomyces sp. NPDC059991 TaxID=3347028 RepID=UPI0036AED88F
MKPGHVGWWYWVLALGGIGTTVVLAYLWHLGPGQTFLTAVSALGPLFLSWQAFRHDRLDNLGTRDVESAVEALADAVRRQWAAEAVIRGLDNSGALPVAWGAADADLVEEWPALCSTARGWPGGPPGNPADWPSTAAGLAGRDGQIGDVFSLRTPTRRLVVLGEPGAGKTTLLIRLLLDLIERRTRDDPVPVLFSLASWQPREDTLPQWMAHQLRQYYRGLAAPAPVDPATQQITDLAQALLDEQRILPILDGFDELPTALRAGALDAVNRSPWIKNAVVLSSRTAEYRDALHASVTMVHLDGAAGIALLPLNADDAAVYLRRNAGATRIRRWDAVVAQLGTSSPVGQALSTPLGLFLARTLYAPRPGPSARDVAVPPDPAELCQPGRFLTRQAVAQHLLGGFIPSAYGPDAPQAHQVLSRLARHLEEDCRGAPDIAWWQLRSLLPAQQAARTIAMTLGTIVLLTCSLTTFMTASLSFGLWKDIVYSVGVGVSLAALTALTIAGVSRTWTAAIGALAELLRPVDRFVSFGWLANMATIAATVWLGFPALRRAAARFRLAGPVRTLALGLTGALVGGGTAGALTYALCVARPAQPYNPLTLPLTLATYALRDGTMLGLFLGLAYAARIGLREAAAAPGGRLAWAWSWPGLRAAFLLGVVLTLVSAGAGTATPLWGSPYEDWRAIAVLGLIVATVAGLTGGIGFGLTVQTPDLATAVGPETVLAQDREASSAMTLMTGGVFLIVFGLPAALVTVTGGTDALSTAAFAMLYALVGAVLGALSRTSFVLFAITQRHLARRHGFPPDLMAFLSDAHSRGVLRQIGPVYQFRHVDLQRHLARDSFNEPSLYRALDPA